MSIILDTPLNTLDSFATLLEANSYLSNRTNWTSSSDESKTEALIYGRYFLDGNYQCTIVGDIPDELKYSNSLLAVDFLIDPSSFYSSKNIKMKRVKADVVESETEFIGGGSKTPPSWLQVQSILQNLCPRINGSVVFVMRT